MFENTGQVVGLLSVTRDMTRSFRAQQELIDSEMKLKAIYDSTSDSNFLIGKTFELLTVNRVGEEKPWNLGKLYGSSYFVDPRGQIFAQASEDKDELLIAEFDLDMIEQVRSVWQFFRDRRPETYGKLTEL